MEGGYFFNLTFILFILFVNHSKDNFKNHYLIFKPNFFISFLINFFFSY
jgi:hypothetical protein